MFLGMTLLAFVLGIVAGLRSMTPLAAVSWAAYLGWLPLHDTRLAWLGQVVTVFIVSAAALGELIVDKLPNTPSRKMPIGFGARVVVGALCGAAVGMIIAGLLAGAIGAVLGTLSGAALRARLAKAIGKDLPAALIEDVVAIGGALLIVSR